ncbi:hypothetical protein [Sphingomonas bacterium]|uniref:hypothetical protein n=1 Tax=Sphingomonas bacterium TaxID=1895847 RepID=UPI00261FE522|nr:hypothetical protein [Sphingomonas bacterium]MDB5679705.1 hypothetical protein [Sphingomonas bacterium]
MALDTRPHRLSLFLLAMALAGCANGLPPPRLTDADLRAAMATDLMGELTAADVAKLPANLDIVGSFTELGTCIDLHRADTSLAEEASSLDRWAELRARFGFGGLTGWRKPGPADGESLATGITERLAHTSARAILKISKRPISPGTRDGWLPTCTQRYWFDAPVYEGNFAFIERDSICGGLCGSGAILALEYRDGSWRLVGVAATWMA